LSRKKFAAPSEAVELRNAWCPRTVGHECRVISTIRTFRRSTRTFFKKATTAWPPQKKQLTIRLDADVLDWLKGHGKGYQTRINRILRVVMESQQPRSVHS
jgi:uncharacterized protein (DUF4415 family)